MHAYDTPSRRPAFSPVPSARTGQEGAGGTSATPIYDSLYAEWVKTFRTLPGDRSGEEDLGFSAFGSAPHSTGSYRSNTYSAYSAGAYSARHGSGHQQSQWQRVGTLGRHQDTGMHYVPAALPPGPRRGV
ncbi:hypothetical protein ACIRU3_31655 [Streptomyces sp. NPDC101151]|uniref:hypothetical protein n=1 Tax=Streptomyces sp. NPDC101151 TaxID=3366115 RepID=UPI00380E342E